MRDPHANQLTALLDCVLKRPGNTSPGLRQAVAERQDVPAELRALIERVHQHAHRVSDEDFVALRTRYSDDQLFELVVSAAVGAAHLRARRALALLEEIE